MGILFLGMVTILGLLFRGGYLTQKTAANLGRDVLGMVYEQEGRGTINLELLLNKLFNRGEDFLKRYMRESVGGGKGLSDKELVNFKFAVVADSSQDTVFFPKILSRIQSLGVDFFLHLGDLTKDGDLAELRESKAIMDKTGLDYYVIPGDHDLNWFPDHSLQNFKAVFKGTTYSSFIHKNTAFILLDNSDHERGMSRQQMEWLEERFRQISELKLEKIFVFTHIPLYNELFPSKVMGQGRDGEGVGAQRDYLLGLFKDFGVDYIFSGDVHHFSQYFEPKTGLKMVTVGAACGESCKSFLPQYVLVTVYKDGRIDIIPKPYRELEDVRTSD